MPDVKVAREAPQVGHQQGEDGDGLLDVVPREAAGVRGIDHDIVVAEEFRRAAPVDRPRRAGHGRTAEAGKVGAPVSAGQPRQVAVERGAIAHQVMAEGGRLGVLQVGIARHQGSGVALRLVENGALQADGFVGGGEQHVAQKNAFGGGALVVAAAASL